MATIITAICLSLYRISGSRTNLALFIAFATINGVYTCEYRALSILKNSTNSGSDLGCLHGFLLVTAQFTASITTRHYRTEEPLAVLCCDVP